MEEVKKNKFENFNREEIYGDRVNAGKRRTYFFDVRTTRDNEYFLTLTESKKRFDEEKGTFYYRKHKIYLFKEDFEKFTNGLNNAIDFVLKNNPATAKKEEPATAETTADQPTVEEAPTTEETPKAEEATEAEETTLTDDLTKDESTDISFEDLEKEE